MYRKKATWLERCIYMYIYMYVYMYIYMYMYIYVYVLPYVYIHTYLYIQFHIHTCICICIYTCIHTQIYTSSPRVFGAAEIKDIIQMLNESLDKIVVPGCGDEVRHIEVEGYR